MKWTFAIVLTAICLPAVAATAVESPMVWGGFAAFLVSIATSPLAALFPVGKQDRLKRLGKQARSKKKQAKSEKPASPGKPQQPEKKGKLQTLRAQAVHAHEARAEEERIEEERAKAEQAKALRAKAKRAETSDKGVRPVVKTRASSRGVERTPGSPNSSDSSGNAGFFTAVLGVLTALAAIAALMISSVFWIPVVALAVMMGGVFVGVTKSGRLGQSKVERKAQGKRPLVGGKTTRRAYDRSPRATASSVSAGRSGGIINVSSGSKQSKAGYRGGGRSANPMGPTLLILLGFVLGGFWFVFYLSGIAVLTGSDLSGESGEARKLTCVYISATGVITREVDFAGSNFRGIAKCRTTFKVRR